MNDFIIIKVLNNISRFINKCSKYNLDLHNIKYLNSNEILVKIRKEDYKLIKRYNYYSDISIYKKLGKDGIIDNIIKEKYLIITFILCVIGMYFISNVIFKIEVIHSNKNIRELVINELEDNGIRKYSIKKKFNELENIKNKILEKNKDNLEWISITNIGMKYIVRVEERIIEKEEKDNEYCNIISTKDALITNIYGVSGEILIKVNDYVRKNDILISGDIKLNEEIKGYTCANGVIYGKVWYNTNVSIKRDYYKKEYTGNKRYNISIGNKILRRIKYNKYDKEYIIKNKYFSFYKEVEYKNKKYKYSEENSLKKVLEEVDNKFKVKLGSNGKVIEKKILNKYISDNEISIDVFVVTEEVISKSMEGIVEEIKNS